MLWIRNGGFIADPDPAFIVNAIRIQGFDRQKLERKTDMKILFLFFGPKTEFYLSLGSIKNVQDTGKVIDPQKKTSSTSKLEISSLLWVIFSLKDPDPAGQNKLGIRIHNSASFSNLF